MGQKNNEKGIKVISGEMLEIRSQSSRNYNDKQKYKKKNSRRKRKKKRKLSFSPESWNEGRISNTR